MTLSLRGRMAVTATAASAITLGTLLVLAGPRLDARARDEASATLVAEARLMARVVEDSLATGTSPASLDPVVDEAAREVHARVTVIAPDGRVVADSALSGPALLEMENHAGRPEVRAALADQPESVERHSATLGAELFYAAVPVHGRGGAVVGVARLSRGVQAITAQGRELWWSAALALSVALVSTGLLTLALSYPLGRSLAHTMEATRRLARGDLTARIAVVREDELGELARVINRSAEDLQQRAGELARDRARTDAILAALGDGVLALDHQGRIVLANARLREALQLGDPIGSQYPEVVSERAVVALVEDVLRSGERRTAELELPRLGRAYTVTAVPFPGAQAAPPGVVLTFDDATERHRLDRMRREFVANASHELRTPLTSIRSFVEVLEDGALEQPATARRFLGKIRTHADRMTALLGDLLSLSRLESGYQQPEWQRVHPQDLAQDAVASFEQLAARKRLSLSSTGHGAPEVVSDPRRLRRILEGLLDNAVMYTPEGGHVRVTTSAAADGAARIDVTDDGPGIAPGHLARIFERFYRVDKARSRELGGTGLGLSIVKHLAEGMGATVSVASTPGRGSCFTVLLPPKPNAGGDAPAAGDRD